MRRNLQTRADFGASGLPELDKFSVGQDCAEPKTAILLKLLRQAASEAQADRPRPFYSVRAVAKRFSTSPATVSRIYQRLSSERLLRLVQGSKTLVEPLESNKKSKPRCIGVVVSLSRFTTSVDYRDAILTIQHELWNHGITEHLIFFETFAVEVLHICKRYHLSAMDTVIWLSPESANKHTLVSLENLGMRVICIAAGPIVHVREFYTLSPDRTISKIVRDTLLSNNQ